MAHRFFHIWFSFVLLLTCNHLRGQEIIAPAGGSVSKGGIQISYTIGETVIQTIEKNEVMLTQGFHQSNLSIIAVKEFNFLAIDVKVYPNPTSDYITIEQITNSGVVDLSAHLFDMHGRLIKSVSANQINTQINMKAFKSATYLLKVIDSNNDFKTFRIVKR